MKRRLHGSVMMGNTRGRTANRARLSWHVQFAATGRVAAGEHANARVVERHRWATVAGYSIEPRHVIVKRPAAEVHPFPVAR